MLTNQVAKRIIVIEDEHILRSNICEILKMNGYHVIEAQNGAQGFMYIQSLIPDLILCDIKMPERDGIWVLEEVRKDPKLSKIPFIFLTAKISPKDVREGMGLGADDYITKPFISSELIRAIESRINRVSELISNNRNPLEVKVLDESEINEFVVKFQLLSKTEKKILKLIATGMSSLEISHQLFNSVKTIDNHRTNISQKLSLKGHLSLLKYSLTVKHLLESDGVD
jgi:DNA-binding NarL/FixJ family response regulator